MTDEIHDGIGMTSLRTRERLIRRLRQGGITNRKVLSVIKETPRHLFVDEAMAHRAYEDVSLPIGLGQTISQPYIVAKMSSLLLSAKPLKKVLEVGTGCGYQAAILAQLVDCVYTIERHEELLNKARRHFRRLGLRNIYVNCADGTFGWAEHGPYDGIIVTAAAEEIPEHLLLQLRDKGRMAIPVGCGDTQELQLIERKGNQFECQVIETVRFVPLVSGA